MKKKTIALLLVLMMVFGVSVGGTVAYLMDTKTVTNTFTVGNVTITLAETKVDEYGVVLTGDDAGTTDVGNTYKLIPGHTYKKDPTITVSAGSEDCWVMAKVENGLEGIASYTLNNGWAPVTEGSNVYVYSTALSAGQTATPFSTFTVAQNYVGAEADSSKTIVVTAYAVQKDTFADATAAWNATFGKPTT